MARIACLMMQRDEEILLRPWLLYHGYLFGFENLYVFDNGSTSERVLAMLDEFARLGVTVDTSRTSDDDWNAQAVILAEKIGTLRAAGLHDVALPLQCSDFVAYDGPNGIACARDGIARELERVSAGEANYRTRYGLSNRPGFIDMFRYTAQTRKVVVMRGTGSACAAADTCCATTSLIFIHMNAKSYPLALAQARRRLGSSVDVNDATALAVYAGPDKALAALCMTGEEEFYAEPKGRQPVLVRFPSFRRLLAGLGVLDDIRKGFEAARRERSPSDTVAVDLDDTPFSSETYAATNPDLAVSGLFNHFLTAGYLEGRLVSPTANAEVLTRLANFRRQVKDGVAGYAGLAMAAHRAREYHAADTILEEAIAEYGPTHALLREHALLAYRQDAHADSATRWKALLSRYPTSEEAYVYAVGSARSAGETEQAHAWSATALKLFPNNANLRVDEVELALDRNELDHAAALLAACTARFQVNKPIARRLNDASFRLQLAQIDRLDTGEVAQLNAPVSVEMTADELAETLEFFGVEDASALSRLFKNFESLGGNCEFGLVQRRCGAEPMGLFRWMGILTPSLIRALDNQLDGVDSADEMELIPGAVEYILRNKRYRSDMHTFQPPRTNPEKLLGEMVRRSRFLKEKLLSDLEAAEKIFVHLVDRPPRPLEQAEQMHDTLLSYGPNTLLYVQVVDDETLWGTVETMRQDLLIGYLRRFGGGTRGEWHIPFQDWNGVIRNVAQLRNLPPHAVVPKALLHELQNV